MNAIPDWTKMIIDITSPNGTEEMRQLVELTEQAIHQHPAIVKLFATSDSTTPSVPRVQTTNPKSTQSVPRVQGTAPNQQLTRSMSQSIELATRQIARVFSRKKDAPTSTPPTQSTCTRPMSRKKRKQSREVAAQSTLDATGCHHQASICPISPQRTPWSSILA